MEFAIEEHPKEIKPCIVQVQDQIYVDKDGVYHLSPDLKIDGYSDKFVAEFIEWINSWGINRTNILGLIKRGEVTVACDE